LYKVFDQKLLPISGENYISRANETNIVLTYAQRFIYEIYARVRRRMSSYEKEQQGQINRYISRH